MPIIRHFRVKATVEFSVSAAGTYAETYREVTGEVTELLERVVTEHGKPGYDKAEITSVSIELA